jgi:glycosyltransferase involved in cell wall biosynthesis
MRVIEKLSTDKTVEGGKATTNNPIFNALQPRLVVRNRYGIKFHTSNNVHHSYGWPNSGLGGEIAKGWGDIINLHWIGHMSGSETLSIAEIGRLKKPIVWTLHDQWAFCGAEHYTALPPTIDCRYSKGYLQSNRPTDESGQDRNRLAWEAKRRRWKHPMTIVCPSQWMATCAKNSLLMRDWPIHVIPYSIDPNIWAPLDQMMSRKILKLPTNKKLILLCADCTNDPRKGADLLARSLYHFKNNEPTLASETELIIIGQSETSALSFEIPYRLTGRLKSDLELQLYYSAANLVIVPSRQDNLPLTGMEAHACGTPAVGFRIGGLPDIIDHRTTGALAEPFETESLASEVAWVLEDEPRRLKLAAAARLKAETAWAPVRIAKQYAEIYSRLAKQS